jgi:hypothetical protein
MIEPTRIEPKRDVIGWREWASLPDLGILHIKTKVDTGAKTSALHAFYVLPFEHQGAQWVRFKVHPLQSSTSAVVECEAPVKTMRRVTDSGGHTEVRYVIETRLMMNGHLRVIELTLTDRETMRFRMLLGRRALKKRFLVDSNKSFILGGNHSQAPTI